MKEDRQESGGEQRNRHARWPPAAQSHVCMAVPSRVHVCVTAACSAAASSVCVLALALAWAIWRRACCTSGRKSKAAPTCASLSESKRRSAAEDDAEEPSMARVGRW